MPTPIDLADLAQVRVERRFVRERGNLVRQELAIGTSSAGWWMSLTCRDQTRAWLAADERAACDLADRRIRHGGWVEVSCSARS